MMESQSSLKDFETEEKILRRFSDISQFEITIVGVSFNLFSKRMKLYISVCMKEIPPK